MKKTISVLLIIQLILATFCGCSLFSSDNISRVEDLSFEYDEKSDKYYLYFGLVNSYAEYIASDVDVEIRIINEESEEVYFAKKSINEKNFGTHSDSWGDSLYLARITIEPDEIQKGMTWKGNAYLKVFKDDKQVFNEIRTDTGKLPIKEPTITLPKFPLEIVTQGYYQNSQSALKITNVDYEYKIDEFGLNFYITVMGEKTEEGETHFDYFNCKLFDKDGYSVASQTLYYTSLNKGEKYKESFTVRDVTPGENYELKISAS